MAEGVGDDRAEVQLTEQLCDAGVTADSHTNLHGNDRLYDDIAEIEIADIADIAEVEVPVLNSSCGKSLSTAFDRYWKSPLRTGNRLAC